ncbi:hypothetical protein ACFSR7_28525 [Cohnella sp. GCM10020058]|uniref:hypothetical protein n=1 Tax=Cohnella sp. GCM10020058 TaxID=3317330 RepID=UPI0036426F3A
MDARLVLQAGHPYVILLNGVKKRTPFNSVSGASQKRSSDGKREPAEEIHDPKPYGGAS